MEQVAIILGAVASVVTILLGLSRFWSGRRKRSRPTAVRLRSGASNARLEDIEVTGNIDAIDNEGAPNMQVRGLVHRGAPVEQRAIREIYIPDLTNFVGLGNAILNQHGGHRLSWSEGVRETGQWNLKVERYLQQVAPEYLAEFINDSDSTDTEPVWAARLSRRLGRLTVVISELRKQL